MDPRIVVEQVTILAILMAVGYIGGASGILGEAENKSMTKLLTNIALPALIFSAFNIGYSEETLRGIILIFILSFLTHIIAALIGKFAFIKYPKEKNGVLRFGNTISNSGCMGIPFVYALFGQEALLYASVFLIPVHMIMWTYGENLLRSEKESLNIKKIIKNPPILAILVGSLIFVLNVNLPRLIMEPVGILSSTTLPLAMLILGERVSKLSLGEILRDRDIYYFSLFRLVITPIVVLISLSFFSIDPLIKNIVVIMQSLPVAVVIVAISEKHGADSRLASKITVVSHIFSVLTIPLVTLLI